MIRVSQLGKIAILGLMGCAAQRISVKEKDQFLNEEAHLPILPSPLNAPLFWSCYNTKEPGRKGIKECVQWMREQINPRWWRDDYEPLERVVIIRNLGELGDLAIDSIPELIEAMSRDEIWNVRNAAQESLIRIGAPAIPYLTEVIRGKDTAAAAWAIDTVGSIGGEQALELIPDLVDFLRLNGYSEESPVSDLRCDVSMRALGLFGEPAITPLVEAIRNQEKHPFPLYEIRVLGRIHKKPEVVVPLLVDIVKNRGQYRTDIVKEALYSLGRYHSLSAPVVPYIREILDSEGSIFSDVALTTLTTLGQIGMPAAADATSEVIDHLFDDDSRISSDYRSRNLEIAAVILEKIGGPAVPHLVKRLKDPNPDRRIRAIQLLGKIGLPASEPAIPELKAIAENDLSSRCRRAARLALGKLEQKQD